MRTYKIHFIRHGLTQANAEGRYIGKTDLPLSEIGVEALEARYVAGDLPEVDMVFTSPLLRCVESCEILYPGYEPIIISDFAEYDFGDFEGKSVYELDGKPEYLAWTSGKTPSPPNGENPSQFTVRICEGLNIAVKKMMQKEIYEAAAVVHGGVIMSLFAACAVPQRKAVEWVTEAGCGFTALITPSLYGKTGVIEIIDTVPSTLNRKSL